MKQTKYSTQFVEGRMCCERTIRELTFEHVKLTFVSLCVFVCALVLIFINVCVQTFVISMSARKKKEKKKT